MSNAQLSEEQIDDIEDVIDTDEEVEKMVEMMDIDDDIDEETVAFFSMAGARVYEPSSLIGKEVPVNHDNEYTVDLPPENPGVLNAFRYKTRRVGRNLNLFKVKNGRNTLNMNGVSVLMTLFIIFITGMIIVQTVLSPSILQVSYSMIFVAFCLLIYTLIAVKNY